MFCPLPRNSVVQSHANDLSPSRRLPIPDAQRRHRHNFRCPMMQIRIEEGKCNRVEIIPCNVRFVPSAPSAAQVGYRGCTKRAAAASPAAQTLLQQCECCVHWGRRGVWEEGKGGEGNLSRGVREREKAGQLSPLVAGDEKTNNVLTIFFFVWK